MMMNEVIEMDEIKTAIYKGIERRIMEELQRLEYVPAEGKRAGRKCTVCQCPERMHIDRMLLRGMPMSLVARIYNLSESAIQRHFKNHVLRMKPSKEILDLVHRIVAIMEGPSIPCMPIECSKESTDNDFYTDEEVF